jgi:SAM-dependent methyltransferase
MPTAMIGLDQLVPTLEQAREALAAEWDARAPTTPEDIAAFYRDSHELGVEIEARHRTDERRALTDLLVGVARNIDAKRVLDVGCGMGHDLRALRAAGIEQTDGVDVHVHALPGSTYWTGIAPAPVEAADLVLCIDVLPLVPDARAWLTSWASRMRLGVVLIETCPSHDVWTPLILKENHGWLPGPTLEGLGFELLDSRDGVRVWQRLALVGAQRASLLLCAYRDCSLPTMSSLMALQTRGWRITTKAGDALIDRSRAIAVSTWYRTTNDDVFLMVDDDIAFEPEAAERIVARCREGFDVVSAAYPVRDGGHLALRGLHGDITFGPDVPPVEVRHAATGFLAVHRRVVAELVQTLPLCHANQPWAFWPMFQPYPMEDVFAGGWNYLSEDWAFCERARALGFTVWLDPSVRLDHLSRVGINVLNMHAVNAALGGRTDA